MKLFATDLDGTLLGPGDTIHPQDMLAIQRARAAGVIFTIATGRLTSRTHPIARRLALDAPLICADGGVLACSTTERVLVRRAVPRDVSVALLDHFAQASISRFVLTHDEVHSCETGRAHHAFVGGWGHQITAHVDVRSAVQPENEPIMLLGIGSSAEVREVTAGLDAFAEWVDVFTFELDGRSVVRLIAKNTSKGAALLDLAERFGVAPQDTCVIGDWYNDLSMFAASGTSFVMPHAPDDVRAHARHALRAEEIKVHGPIATALNLWLDA